MKEDKEMAPRSGRGKSNKAKTEKKRKGEKGKRFFSPYFYLLSFFFPLH